MCRNLTVHGYEPLLILFACTRLFNLGWSAGMTGPQSHSLLAFIGNSFNTFPAQNLDEPVIMVPAHPHEIKAAMFVQRANLSKIKKSIDLKAFKTLGGFFC